MTKRGLKPTGIAIFEAQQQGFASVAHYVQVDIFCSHLCHLAACTAAYCFSTARIIQGSSCLNQQAMVPGRQHQVEQAIYLVTLHEAISACSCLHAVLCTHLHLFHSVLFYLHRAGTVYAYKH